MESGVLDGPFRGTLCEKCTGDLGGAAASLAQSRSGGIFLGDGRTAGVALDAEGYGTRMEEESMIGIATNRTRSSGRFSSLASGLAVLLLALPSCAVKTSSAVSDPALLRAGKTYAWAEPPTLPGDLQLDPARFRGAVDERMAGLGYGQVDREGNPSLLVSLDVRIEVKQEFRDPYFAFVNSALYEVGYFTVRLVNPQSGKVAWQGGSRVKLRYTAEEYSGYTSVYVPFERPRDWRLETVFDEIFEELHAAIRAPAPTPAPTR